MWKLAVLAALGCCGAAGAFFWRDELRGVLDAVTRFVRTAGPLPYFAALIVLPGLGVPSTVFTLSAGPLFAAKYGIVPVIIGVILGMGLNLMLSYWLAYKALRPWFERLVARLGYKLPEVAPEDHVGLTVLVRVTPGSPFFAQNYLLGLAKVPFRIYVGISWPIVAAFSIAFVLFGDSLVNGKGKVVFLAVSLLIALTVGVHWLRRRFQRRKAVSAAAATPVS